VDFYGWAADMVKDPEEVAEEGKRLTEAAASLFGVLVDLDLIILN
jgi:hypothetical protein